VKKTDKLPPDRVPEGIEILIVSSVCKEVSEKLGWEPKDAPHVFAEEYEYTPINDFLG
jgi:hypothetical protein